MNESNVVKGETGETVPYTWFNDSINEENKAETFLPLFKTDDLVGTIIVYSSYELQEDGVIIY